MSSLRERSGCLARPCGARLPALWRSCFASRPQALLTLALVAAITTSANTATAPGDKAALLAFKNGLTSDGGVLASWTPATDPCDDGWAGVRCNCSDLFRSDSAAQAG